MADPLKKKQSSKGAPEDALTRTLTSVASIQRAMQPSVVKMLENITKTQRMLAPSVLESITKVAETQRAMQPSVVKMLENITKTQRMLAPLVLESIAKTAQLRAPPVAVPRVPDTRIPREPPLPRAWLAVQTAIRIQVIRVLTTLDARLEARLNGAWERVSRGGPDAPSQAAHSLVELIDWALRIGAPDSEAVKWHRETGRPHHELHVNAPTRALRARYLLRNRDPDGAPANLYVRQLCDVHRLLEQIKHNPDEANVRLVACLASTTEAILTFLFLPEQVSDS